MSEWKIEIYWLVIANDNSPEQDRASDCKTNPELTGHSWKERQERVLNIVCDNQQLKEAT